jgi:hypothetical protein
MEWLITGCSLGAAGAGFEDASRVLEGVANPGADPVPIDTSTRPARPAVNRRSLGDM